MQISSKNLTKIAPKTSPKAIQKSFKNRSQNLSVLGIPKKRVLRIYIYMIFVQPGLTLEREARSILETMYSGNGFAFVLKLASHCHDMGFAPILTSTSHSFWHRLRLHYLGIGFAFIVAVASHLTWHWIRTVLTSASHYVDVNFAFVLTSTSFELLWQRLCILLDIGFAFVFVLTFASRSSWHLVLT